MTIINIHEAKTHFSRLVERVAAGEEIIIGKAGKPVARVVPYSHTDAIQRKPGSMRGRIRMGVRFDEPVDDINTALPSELL